ncbi:nucleotide exchange factor GrpE [Mycolicibacterium vaccae]|uniref:Protein GrpE n=2 Tax=Mycolicibacterium vaccae TaxID=1810 RepID=K0V3R2_MYCVA|nr:nucleotide exchange factor GrpE [Mycolicibacterium vaccae]ANI37742.1 co-chaperone GrpE [Mycolicibacterium vaccae 95051]EJZ09433.1 molecular chaperone GrpE (heat shock protein) [Mycolicibacterium vaccae ATCC 25954]BBF96552.1 heat shock protein GrpE [Mycolicibacterium vaccae]BBF96612.1 heat shock protein GrpE [Mycolicibacterium vaccae]
MSANDHDRVREEEPITVTDKRRIDPETGQVREAAGPAPSGPAPAAPAAEPAEEPGKESGKEAELLADLQRVQAEFANYRKRSLRDQQLIADRAKATVISQLLPVLDDLDRARSHGDLESGPLKAVADKIVTTLEGLGLTSFGEEGDVFDPELHEAVQHEGDGTHPVLGMVMRRGYKVGDQVVRHAMVGVVDTEPGASDSDKADAEPEQPAES